MNWVLLLVLPWSCDFASRVNNQRQLVADLTESKRSGSIAYEFWSNSKEPRVPKAVRKWLGDDVFYEITFVQLWGPKVTDDKLRILAQLKSVRDIYISGVADRSFHLVPTAITNDGMRHLASMENLREIVLTDASIDDKGLKHLHGMKQLQKLALQRTRVTQNGIKELQRQLPKCQVENRGD